MRKMSLAAAFAAALALTPAYAAEDLCTEAHMKQMDEMVAKMTDATKKKEAMMHLDMSFRTCFLLAEKPQTLSS